MRRLQEITIWKQLNFSRMTVHRMEQRLKALEFIKNRPRSGRPQVISQEATKKLFENKNLKKIQIFFRIKNSKTKLREKRWKITRLEQKKIVFSLLNVQDVHKNERKTFETLQETPVDCKNGSEAYGEKCPFVEWHEESRESNPQILRWDNFYGLFYLQQTE